MRGPPLRRRSTWWCKASGLLVLATLALLPPTCDTSLFGEGHWPAPWADSDDAMLPASVLPACTAWRRDSMRGDLTSWQSAFHLVDADNDGRVAISDVGFVFQVFLLRHGLAAADFGEDVRRVMEVLRADAHVDPDACAECLIDFEDLKNIMWAYTTRMLSPADVSAVGAGTHAEYHLFEYHGSGRHSGQVPSESHRMSVLRKVPKGERNLVRAAGILSSPADQRAKAVALLSDEERKGMLKRRTPRISLVGTVVPQTPGPTARGYIQAHHRRSIVQSNGTTGNFSGCGLGQYYSHGNMGCSNCSSCPPGKYRHGCGEASEGNCVSCEIGTVKRFEGDWNTTCVQCPLGSSTWINETGGQGGNFTDCYFMHTCRQYRDNGHRVSKVYHLSLQTARSYLVYNAVPFVDNGSVPEQFPSRQAFCDMNTDGGGWMLMLCYHRDRYNAEGVNGQELPLDPYDPTSCWSHLYLKSFSNAVMRTAAEVRLYCTSSNHDRILHFKTSNQGVLGLAKRGVSQWNQASWWTEGATPLQTCRPPACTTHHFWRSAGNCSKCACRSDGMPRYPNGVEYIATETPADNCSKGTPGILHPLAPRCSCWGVSGYLWHSIGRKRPSEDQGHELKNDKLSEALLGHGPEWQSQFQEGHWKAFGIERLRPDHYIQAGKHFFRPEQENGVPTDLALQKYYRLWDQHNVSWVKCPEHCVPAQNSSLCNSSGSPLGILVPGLEAGGRYTYPNFTRITPANQNVSVPIYPLASNSSLNCTVCPQGCRAYHPPPPPMYPMDTCSCGCQQKECQCQCTVHNYTLCPWGGHYDDTEASRKFLSEEHCLNHTAILPFATNKTNFQVDTETTLHDGFLKFPFFRPPHHHWAIHAQGRFECDDDGGAQSETHHQVWVRHMPAADLRGDSVA